MTDREGFETWGIHYTCCPGDNAAGRSMAGGTCHNVFPWDCAEIMDDTQVVWFFCQ